MEKRLGLIAGSGESPLYIYQEAKKQGYTCVVAAIREEADSRIESEVSDLGWFEVAKAGAIVSYFKSKQVERAVFAGKVDPQVVFRKKRLGSLLYGLIEKGHDKNPETLIRMAIDYFSSRGIEIIDPLPFLKALLCDQGVLTKTAPSAAIQDDIDFAWQPARKLADWDIGQSLVVKDKRVVAVEGLEGTDETVKRGGELAGSGTVLVKVARTQQDSRIDLPAVGLKTVESLVKAKSKGLCFDAERMPFFQKERAIALADKHDIAIVAR